MENNTEKEYLTIEALASSSQPTQTNNESMESLNVGF